MTACATEILERVARRVLTPTPPLTVREWADRHRVLTSEMSAEPGRWDTRRTPYLAGPMAAFDNPHVRQVSLMWAAQLAKTELLIGCIGHACAERPRPTLFAIANGQLARHFVQTRIQPSILASERWSRHLRGNPRDLKVDRIDFDRMHLSTAGAHSRSNLKGRPVGLLLCDEIDEWPDGNLSMAMDRVAAWADHKIVVTSTPTDEDVGIDAEYKKGDRRTYYVPCPECGQHHKLVFSNLRWDKDENGEQPSPDDAERTAVMVCPDCGCEIREHCKTRMLAAGVWLPAGERPAGEGEAATREAVAFDGSVVRVAGRPERPASSHASFQLSAFYSPFMTWGKIARRFAEAGYRMTREIATGILGEPWRAVNDRIDRGELDLLRTERRHGGFVLGDVPAACPLLVTAVDVQADRAYVMTVGFGAGMKRWAIVDWRELAAPEGNDLAELDASGRDVEGRAWPGLGALEYRCGDRVVRPLAVGIDIGHRTGEVYAVIRRLRASGMNKPGRRAWPVKGDNSPSAHAAWRPMRCENLPGDRARKLPEHLRLDGLLVNTNTAKDSVLGIVKRSLAQKREREAPDLLVPEDAPGAMLDGLVAEERKIVTVKGRPALVWAPRAGIAGAFNHPTDCLVYAVGMGIRERLDGYTPELIAAWLVRAGNWSQT